MVVLHSGLLVGAVAEVWIARPPFYPVLGFTMLALVLVSQALRWWCIATLGHRWNTRVIVVPDLPLVTTGPYRWFSHPNYVAVVVEGFALPLVHTAWVTAVVFTVLNAVLLTVRIRVENKALRQLPDRLARACRMLDVLVAGGGPVGLATALYAHRAGLDVVDLRATRRQRSTRRAARV